MGGSRAPGRATSPSWSSMRECPLASRAGTQAGIQPVGAGAGREGGNEMVAQKHPSWTAGGESLRKCWAHGQAVSLMSLTCAPVPVCARVC